ncbi:hypothetical protein [Pectobacterium polaris]|uniref:hypothetical protein n=1 Tax=Pectobacterium polaris TaxID=2042057 RepID=UPI001CF597B1|nr:hypothetical protein [Pectobacterium polaris]MCA6952631.1 hypothetical protein [Pectobacterium polaris]
MGFKDAKKQLIVCLQSGNVLHEARGNISTKNLLVTGQISIIELIDIIYQSAGHPTPLHPIILQRILMFISSVAAIGEYRGISNGILPSRIVSLLASTIEAMT